MKVANLLRNAMTVGVVLSTVVLALAGTQGAAGASTPRMAARMMSAAAAPDPRLAKLVAEAKHQTTLGISYLYAGGHGAYPAPLNSHVDCSGLVRELYNYAFGVDIGSGSGDGMIRTSGEFTRTSSPVPGDVVLLGNGGSAPAYHSGIYIGTVNGEPSMVGSPETGENIKVQPSRGGTWGGDLMGYWHYKGATAVVSAPKKTPAPVNLSGSYDTASARVGSFSVAGWIVDPQRTAGGNQAQVLVDGHSVAVLGTPIVRADVNRIVHASGAHGFSATIAADPGRHSICITARPSGTSSRAISLGCKDITVPPTPTRGSYDSLTSTKGTFAVSGWAYDVRSSAITTVRITSDGRLVALPQTTIARPDVNRIFGITGTHGFHVRVAALHGRHTVCATGLPAVATSAATDLGCKSITVA